MAFGFLAAFATGPRHVTPEEDGWFPSTLCLRHGLESTEALAAILRD
jgi:hypothetical protein